MELSQKFRQKLSIFESYQAHCSMAPILLGTLFNVLDAVSTGLLIFPSGPNEQTFNSLQTQGMSMYVMSTLVSQIAMTLGGSRFPGALGAMLIEILPFLRGIATDIRQNLGDDNPRLVPTVMVAYTMTSFFIGICFILLGLMRAGRLVAYFPQTVLVGTIGAIGISLFVLGLGLPIPASTKALSLSDAGGVLFNKAHLPLLFASCAPAFFLSISMRSQLICRWSRGATENAYYVPIFLILIPAVFWVVVGALGLATASGMSSLASEGWLFRISTPEESEKGLGSAWIYWKLFDFHRVKISALKSATTNIVLLVLIGVLNLPIYVPALGIALDEPIHMNHELLGQGLANILAGITGTAPNILQLSYSIFFTKAGGGRIEAGIVTCLTLVLFLVASKLLPYIPTILASALVLFLGIELTLEAVWESTKTLLPSEYGVVLTTLITCTFVGFAPGFGIGLAAACIVYLLWRVVGMYDHHRRRPTNTARSTLVRWRTFFQQPRLERGVGCFTDSQQGSRTDEENVRRQPVTEKSLVSESVQVIVLHGYVFFATIPLLEKLIDRAKSMDMVRLCLMLNLGHVQRIETSAAQFIGRKTKELGEIPIVLCNMTRGSRIHADLERGGLHLVWSLRRDSIQEQRPDAIRCFTSYEDALGWWEDYLEDGLGLASTLSSGVGSSSEAVPGFTAKEHTASYSSLELEERGASAQNSELQAKLYELASALPVSSDGNTNDISPILERLIKSGISLRTLKPGEVYERGMEVHRPRPRPAWQPLLTRWTGFERCHAWVVVAGCADFEHKQGSSLPGSRLSTRAIAGRFTKELVGTMSRRLRRLPANAGLGRRCRRLCTGQFYVESDGEQRKGLEIRGSGEGRSWLLEVRQVADWPVVQAWAAKQRQAVNGEAASRHRNDTAAP